MSRKETVPSLSKQAETTPWLSTSVGPDGGSGGISLPESPDCQWPPRWDGPGAPGPAFARIPGQGRESCHDTICLRPP